MSEDFEDYLRSQTLKEPSADLDDRVLSLFDSQEQQKIKEFPWQKFVTYAVAAMLFLAIGVTELVQRSQEKGGATVQTPAAENFTDGTSGAVPTMKVSTSGSSDTTDDPKLRKIPR